MDNWMDNLRPSPQPQDEWAAERIHELAAHCHAWTVTHKTAPPQDWTNELASLTATWHAQQAAKAQANNGPRTAAAAAASYDDNQPTGEPIKLSELPRSVVDLPPVDFGALVHAPADPGIQAEGDPWTFIVRHNGHAWRMWHDGRIDYASHPGELFRPVDLQRGVCGQELWFDADGWRFVVDSILRTCIRVPLDSAGRAMHGFKAALDIQPEALTWWPG